MPRGTRVIFGSYIVICLFIVGLGGVQELCECGDWLSLVTVISVELQFVFMVVLLRKISTKVSNRVSGLS